MKLAIFQKERGKLKRKNKTKKHQISVLDAHYQKSCRDGPRFWMQIPAAEVARGLRECISACINAFFSKSFAQEILVQEKKKNRQQWRCYRPKSSLGGPGRPPQPEFASKITARCVNFSGNSQPKLRFGVFFCFFVLFSFQFSVFFEKNGTVSSPNTLSEAPGDLRSRNLHPKSGPVASTFLVIRNQN